MLKINGTFEGVLADIMNFFKDLIAQFEKFLAGIENGWTIE